MLLLFLLLGLALPIATPRIAESQSEPTIPKTLQAGLLARFDESCSKLLQLGEALPAEKYSWRPAAGVRSIGEVLVHVGLGNYYTTSDAGAAPAIKVSDEAEKTIKSKAQVLAFLRGSITHMHNALERLTPADLEHATTMFGQATNYENVYLFGISHVHEHLGQLVAYARINGVTPPWSHQH